MSPPTAVACFTSAVPTTRSPFSRPRSRGSPYISRRQVWRECWQNRHKTVCHTRGEYARDEDGDGFCEIHVNTMEGTWSLLRSWLRPHRGISQEKLPLYLGFFEFVHNVRRRGKALLGALVSGLVG